MEFTSKLSSMSDAPERDELGSRVARRTEKYVFFISAAVASFLTPRAWYGSLGADKGVEAWKCRWFPADKEQSQLD